MSTNTSSPKITFSFTWYYPLSSQKAGRQNLFRSAFVFYVKLTNQTLVFSKDKCLYKTHIHCSNIDQLWDSNFHLKCFLTGLKIF